MKEEHYTPDGKTEYKTLEVEDWEEKASDITEWMNENLTYSRWKVYGSALLLATMPQQAMPLVFAYILYKAYKKGFILSGKYVKEAKVEEE